MQHAGNVFVVNSVLPSTLISLLLEPQLNYPSLLTLVEPKKGKPDISC
jgi:hypothetical protein